MFWRWACLLSVLFVCFCASTLFDAGRQTAFAEPECKRGEWKQIDGEYLGLRESCQKINNRSVKSITISIDVTKYKLYLSGSNPINSKVPSFKDVYDNEINADGVFSLRYKFKKSNDLILMNVGYPSSDEIYVPSGLVRIAGTDVSSKDEVAHFKSALLCVDEAGRNPGKGSRVIMFSAFENLVPVTMNRRVADSKNCPEVVQVGPRIVEYRSKGGIEGPSRGQKWLTYSQGSGPARFGYVTLFLDEIGLHEVQAMFLVKNRFSEFDEKMRFAVVLTSGKSSALAYRFPGEAGTRIEGNLNKRHPVMMGIRKVE